MMFGCGTMRLCCIVMMLCCFFVSILRHLNLLLTVNAPSAPIIAALDGKITVCRCLDRDHRVSRLIDAYMDCRFVTPTLSPRIYPRALP
jgi:hypothetical protein